MSGNDLTLPTATRHEKDPPRKANYITVEASGRTFLNKQQVEGQALLEALIGLRLADPDLSVIVRGDGKAK